MGYEETPPEVYELWLGHVNSEKEKAVKHPSSTLRKEVH